ncbi:hypothetical protein ACWGKS_29480 [Nocardiopsis sp. NPDC055879]
MTFPEPSVSVGYVEAMASGLRELGTSIADTGNDITSSWAGLSAHYSAPEAETLFSVLDPVATDGDTIGEELDRAARALENFAEDVADIKTRWSNLRVEAYDLRSRILAKGDDWRKAEDTWDRIVGNESPLKEENDALIEQGRTIITDYTEVENTCANAINAGISGRTNFEKQPEGDAELDPNVFYHGFEQDISELAEAWGHEGAQTDHGWWVDVGHSVWDFGVDAVQGVGAMVGAHSSEGWFQASWGDALKEYHWDNLTSAASLVGMYDAESDSLGWNGGEGVGEAWKDLAHSVVPWEEWGDRPGYVIGTAALNVIGLVGGAALTATGVGAVVGVPLMAWRGMSIMDGMGGSGRGGSGGGADIDLPQIPDIPRFGGSGSPLINLAGRALDATGFGPSQLADFKAMVNRLMPSGQNGVEPAGSASTQTAGETEEGRPSGARPTQASAEADQRPVQRPVQDSAMDDPSESDTSVPADTRVFVGSATGETGSGRSGVDHSARTAGGIDQSPDQDPTVGDALVGDDILNHPDIAEIDNKTKSDPAAQRDLAGTDWDRKISQPKVPVSNEVRAASWASSPSSADPRGDNNHDGSDGDDSDQGPEGAADRQPVLPDGTVPKDTLKANVTPDPPAPFPPLLSVTGIGTPGGGGSFGNEISNHPGNLGAELLDNNPVARNQGGGGASGQDSSSTTRYSDSQNSDSTSQGTFTPSSANVNGGSSAGSSSGGSAFHSQDPLKIPWGKTGTVEEVGLSGSRVNDGAKPVLPENELKKEEVKKENKELSPEPGERFGDKGGLSPDTSYEVFDRSGSLRGTYITDASGEIRRIELDISNFDRKHPEFVDPRPNAEYRVKTPSSRYAYQTNSYGDNLESEGRFTPASSPRFSGEERAVTKAAREYYDTYNRFLKEDFAGNPEKYPGLTEAPQFEKTTWNGGHVVGIGEFGGIPERLNQVAMRKSVNQHAAAEWRVGKSYRNFEMALERVNKGEFEHLEGRSKNPDYLAEVELWKEAYRKAPPPPDIRARVKQVYDPMLPTFEVRKSNGNLSKVLNAPPAAISIEFSINGVLQDEILFPNRPKLK